MAKEVYYEYVVCLIRTYILGPLHGNSGFSENQLSFRVACVQLRIRCSDANSMTRTAYLMLIHVRRINKT